LNSRKLEKTANGCKCAKDNKLANMAWHREVLSAVLQQYNGSQEKT